jgi:hypothetical protein
LEFSRKGRRADGSETEVGFSIAFARYPASQHAAFITCRQTRPENFWAPELQRHANGAKAIGSVVMVAENPTDHHIFLEAFSGARDVRASSLGLRIATRRGEILAIDPRGFSDMFEVEPPRDEGLRLAALVIRVADLSAAGKLLEKNGVRHRLHRERLVVDPQSARGATIALEQL